jgi:hypothetical protein
VLALVQAAIEATTSAPTTVSREALRWLILSPSVRGNPTKKD